MSEGKFRCKQLQHIDGARQVTGPVGPPDWLRLKAEHTEKDEAEALMKYGARYLHSDGVFTIKPRSNTPFY